eukprot:gene14091-14210_t
MLRPFWPNSRLAHGLHYGIPASIETWLASGDSVICNCSRAAIAQARERFSGVAVVLITASPEVLAERLAGRARETTITGRLERADEHVQADYIIVNDGAADIAIDASLFLCVILSKNPDIFEIGMQESVMSLLNESSQNQSCKVVKASTPFVGKQGLTYAPGISAETVGAQGLHLQLLTIPPGGRGKAHKHEPHESAIYVLSGDSAMYFGDQLEHHLTARAGDFLYIPANVPHLPYNLSATEPCIAVISRTDPNEQESVVLLPELDAIHSFSK